MSLSTFPVAYYDEFGVWDEFKSHLISRLPLSGESLNSAEGDILLPPLPVSFIPHTEAFWQPDPEDTYLRPYLWIFVLKFTNYEIFKRDFKVKLKELIHRMQENNIEWIVLFVPTLKGLVKSDHKSFLKYFTKLSSEIASLFGKSNTAKFYCVKNKTFVDLEQPSAIKDAYWQDFLRAVGKGISLGIQKTIEVHNKASLSGEFFKRALNFHAMAIVYELIGLKNQVCACYDQIRLSAGEYDKFITHRDLELAPTFEMSTQDFRNSMKAAEISLIALQRYILPQIIQLLEASKSYERISEATYSILQVCRKNFNSKDQFAEFFFLYRTSCFYANIIDKHLLEINKELRPKSYYFLGSVLNIAKCALYSLVKLRVAADFKTKIGHEIEEILCDKSACLEQFLILSRKIYTSFAFGGYSCTALIHKYEAIVFAFQLGKIELISEILDQFSLWPSIDSVNLKYLLCNNIEAHSTEAVKNILEICCLGYFSAKELKSMWDKVPDLAVNNVHAVVSGVKVYTMKFAEAVQGQAFAIRIKLISSLKLTIDVQSITALYSNESSSFELERSKTTIHPGTNLLELKGIAWQGGLFKLDSIFGIVNKLKCCFLINSAKIRISDSQESLGLQVANHANFMPQHTNYIIAEIKLVNIDQQPTELFVDLAEPALIEPSSKFVSFSEDSKEIHDLIMVDNVLNLPLLKKQSWNYAIFSTKGLSELPTSLQVSFQLKSSVATIGQTMEISLRVPLEVLSTRFDEKDRTILTLRISNNVSSPITLLSLKLQGPDVLESTALPATIDPYHEFFITCVLPPSSTLNLTLCYTFPNEFLAIEPFIQDYLKSHLCLTESVYEHSIILPPL